MKVAWYSCGVSSFIAAYLAKDVDRLIYCHIENQHPDSLRFLSDCEGFFGKRIEILQSEHQSVEKVVEKYRFLNSPYGAKCTNVLKKQVRKEWEKKQNEPLTYVWGYDCTEKHRSDRLQESEPDTTHEFPLIDAGMTKEDCHKLSKKLGLKRPKMYDMGYPNNNCIGCVKGGMGYWNMIRKDFPEAFERMAKLEREIGHSCIKNCFLDELSPNRGRKPKPILEQ
ncbi:phosphoadenosine phosphosulfate reductase [Eubacterium callanderi]|uniref:Phosphoadenosine phosphosulfate reductase n=2 Tax=Bacillota TaxID=1239 RepID=A0A853JUI4_9FIRM|nr:phosphoadenosine phosphosulfate reductase [Eubacterium callanderi]